MLLKYFLPVVDVLLFVILTPSSNPEAIPPNDRPVHKNDKNKIINFLLLDLFFLFCLFSKVSLNMDESVDSLFFGDRLLSVIIG